jgi:hypothetical protein
LSPPSKVASFSLVVPDERLKVRGDPRVQSEHDLLGFRNVPRQPPQSSPFVAIGDSQTYGTSVDWREAWPKQLERQLGEAVYNMGCSSWGPVEYREILADALKLKPKLVIVGFYFGNDVFDAYRDSYFWPTGADLCDAAQSRALRELDRRDPIMDRIGLLARATMENAPPVRPEDASGPGTNPPPIDRYGKLWALANATWRVVSGLKRQSEEKHWQETVSWAQGRPDDLIIVDAGPFRTILTPAYRGIAVDRADLRIAEGDRIAKTVIEQMADKCKKAGCELLVVLIPTKETVYAEPAGDALEMPAYAKLLADESAAVKSMTKFLNERKIAYTEALPELRGCFKAGANPYWPAADGHPSAAGQHAIAKAIATHPLVQALK